MTGSPLYMDIPGPHFIIGRWHVERRIVHRGAIPAILFVGKAEISEGAFEETGELHIGQARMTGVRKYQLQMSNDEVEIRFPDRRFFASLAMRAAQKVSHRCGNDQYC